MNTKPPFPSQPPRNPQSTSPSLPGTSRYRGVDIGEPRAVIVDSEAPTPIDPGSPSGS